jgi:hypothetical protein
LAKNRNFTNNAGLLDSWWNCLLTTVIWSWNKFGGKLLSVSTTAYMRAVGFEVFLVVVILAVAIAPAAYAQDIPGLKIKAEQGDVQAQSALGKAYHTGEGVVQGWRRARLLR